MPGTSAVNEFGLPRLNVAVQVGDELILFVPARASRQLEWPMTRYARETGTEVRDTAGVGLLRPAKVGLRDEDVP